MGMPLERDDVAAPAALELDLVDGIGVEDEAAEARAREGRNLMVGAHVSVCEAGEREVAEFVRPVLRAMRVQRDARRV